jgi:uncharacterized protein (TIGR02145 family)
MLFFNVKIGNQIWMSSNLNVCKFRNGDEILEAKTIDEWREADEKRIPAWCNYENKAKNDSEFGKLYNWHAVNDKRNLAPENWRIPSDKDFEVLSNFLGGAEYSGKLLKHTTDSKKKIERIKQSLCFNSFPGGARLWSHEFCAINEYAFYWTSTEYNNYFAWHRVLINNYETFCRVNQGGKGFGMSVRCILNN